MLSVDQFVIAHHKSKTTKQLQERLNSSAGSLRMYARMAGVPYPGHLERVPFWDDADRHLQQGLSAQEIAKRTQSTRQHIEQYILESGQKEAHTQLRAQRSVAFSELTHTLDAYHHRRMPALARALLNHAKITPQQSLAVDALVQRGYSPKEISEHTGHPAPTVSGWLVHAGIRERAFTARPKKRREAYQRLEHTGLSIVDAAVLLGVTPSAVKGYAIRNSMRLAPKEHPHRWQRMEALSVPDLSYSEVAYVLGISEEDAQQAQDPSWSDTLTRDVQILFDDTRIDTPFVSRAYIHEWLSQ